MDPIAGNTVMILSLIAGSALVILEAFIPGFGVAGVTGIILEILGVIFAWIHHGTWFAMGMTALVLCLIGVTVYLSYRSAMKGRLSKSPLILKDQAKAEEKKDSARWLDRKGVAVTAMRPGGFVEIDGIRLNAASEGEWIQKGAGVKVTGAEGDHLIIRAEK